MLQKNFNKMLLLILVSVSAFSCKKDSFTPVNMSALNPDSTASNTALDAWLKTNFLDPYNVDVIYHTNSYFHEYDRNVTPPDPSTVQPYLQTVLSGYYAPYNDVAGVSFLKQYGFKEFVLWGSTSYDASLVPYAGTASGGVRINIFGLDGFTLTPPSYVTSRLNVIHHEFTHILQQTFPMPPDFQQFTAAYYSANWTKTPRDTAHKYGFVTNYASQNPVEDMAETVAYLLVSGESWYDYWVKTSTAGATGLRQKEASMLTYFNNIGIDFRALQKDVQLYIKDSLKDPSVTFPYWLNQGTPYTSMTVNLTDQMYSLYGQSASFAAAYKQLSDSMAAVPRYLTNISLLFTKKDSMTLRVNYTNAAGSAFAVDNDFAMKINTTAGTVQFVKVANKAGTNYSNGTTFGTKITNTIVAYLTSKIFIGDWLQYNEPGNLYTKTGGFYVQSDPSNYFYGPLAE